MMKRSVKKGLAAGRLQRREMRGSDASRPRLISGHPRMNEGHEQRLGLRCNDYSQSSLSDSEVGHWRGPETAEEIIAAIRAKR